MDQPVSSTTRLADEWELSKENVLPLKQGRKMNNLTAALQPQSIDRQQQLILQRQAYETELRAYSGDDPLDPWIRYITWTEQNFPRGGKDSHLSDLMQKCLIQFKHDERYKQDPRYVSIWLKMAQYESDGLEIYQFMQVNQIGTRLTIFYEAWAWDLEQLGNTKKADTVYKEGLNCNAQPRERLEKSQVEFQSRVARATMVQLQEEMTNPMPGEDQRATLGDLKARGKLQKVGTQRTGATKLGSRGGLGMPAPAPLQQKGNHIPIFCDEGQGAVSQQPASLPASAGDWTHLPSRTEAQKENTRAAGQWTGQRIPQRNAPSMGFQEAASYSKPNFAVHVDENADQLRTPHKPLEMGPQVLSARKPSKQTNVLQHIKQDATNDNTRVRYCKHLIYGGAREMSFEELRAIKHNNKKKEEELQAKMAALQRQEEELRQKQEQQQEIFKQFQQELEQQRLQHQQLVELLITQKQNPSVPAQQPGTTQSQPSQPAAFLQQPLPVAQSQGQPSPMLPQEDPIISSQQKVPLPSQHIPLSVHEESIPPSTQPQPCHPMMQQAVQPQLNHEQLEKQKMPQEDAPQMPSHPDSVYGHQTQERRHRLNSGDASIACTKQLLFDDITSTGNFNVYCDPNTSRPTLPIVPSTSAPAVTASSASLSSAPISEPEKMEGCESIIPTDAPAATNTSALARHGTSFVGDTSAVTDMITPNQSLLLNGSNPSFKTPSSNPNHSTGGQSNKTPSSSAKLGGAHSRLTKLGQIRTPGGLTAPSPTINTREAMGVINAMLNSTLDSNLFGWDAPAPTEDQNFEMEFANTETNENKSKKGFIYEDTSAFQRVGDFNGVGIVPRRQPLAIRPGPLSAPGVQPPAPSVPVASSSSNEGVVRPLTDDVPMSDHPIDQPQTHVAPSQVAPSHVMTSTLPSSQDAGRQAGAAQRSQDIDLENVLPHPKVENLNSCNQVSSAQKFHIFQDDVVEDNKENTSPPKEYEQVREGRVLTGILQPSEGIPFKPLEDEPVPSVDMEAVSNAEPAQTNAEPLTSYNTSQVIDMTFAPTGSNQSFEVAARMASTPFNDTTNRKLSFIPPMSTIKSTEIQTPLQMTDSEKGLPLRQSNIQRVPQLGSVHPAGLPSRVVPRENESFDKTEYTVNHSGGPLSPIMETSAENIRSSASSSSSATNSHGSVSSLGSSQHALNNVTNKEDIHPPPTVPAPLTMPFTIHEDDGKSNCLRSSSDPQMEVMKQARLDMSLGGLPPTSTIPFMIHRDDGKSDHIPSPSDHRMEMLQEAHPDVSAMAPTSEEVFLAGDHSIHMAEQSGIPLGPGEAGDVSIHTHFDDMVDEQPDYTDPFSVHVQSMLLAGLAKPLSAYKGYYEHPEEMPFIKPGLAVDFGDDIKVYNVIDKVGEGAFATIYLARSLDANDITDLDGDDSGVVLKVQSPACPWEFYIMRELFARLSRLPSQIDVRPSLMSAEAAHIYGDSSCLVTEYHINGTLLDLINKYKAVNKKNMNESWVILFTIEILQTVEFMHRCKIIHGDIKPDNFLVANFDIGDVTLNHGSSNLLRLTDMGRSIDMSLFPEDTVFTSKCNTSGFNCVEMQTGRPWTYQVDYYGIAGTVHCLLFGSYMKVFHEGEEWKITSNVPRGSKADWKKVFHTLLNVPSCDPADLPHLGQLHRHLESVCDPSEKANLKIELELMMSGNMPH